MKVYRCILLALFVVMAGWQLCAASLCGVHSVQIGYDLGCPRRGSQDADRRDLKQMGRAGRVRRAQATAGRERHLPGEHEGEDDKTLRSSADNARKRALLNGLNHVKAEVAK